MDSSNTSIILVVLRGLGMVSWLHCMATSLSFLFLAFLG